MDRASMMCTWLYHFNPLSLGPQIVDWHIPQASGCVSPGLQTCVWSNPDPNHRLYSLNSIETDQDIASLQQDIGKLQEWANTWQMRFHPEKCKTLNVMNPGAEHRYQMDNNGTVCVLDQVHEEKDLGVITDDMLLFEEQCRKSVNAANKILFTIWRTFTFIDEKTMLQLYKPLVRSRLEYGVEIWSPNLKRLINEVEAVQRRATRMIPSLKDLPYEERLRKLKLPSLVYRRKRGEMIQTYKYMHGEYDSDCNKIFKRTHETRTRGHDFKLFKEWALTATRAQSFTSRVIVPRRNEVAEGGY